MCFTVSQQKDEMVSLIKSVEKKDHQNKISFEQIQSNYFVSGFQYPKLVVIRENEINQFNWGLIPFWTKTGDDALKIRSMTLNARAETIFDKPSFRTPIKSRRCVLPVNGFFEWKEIDKEKIPHYIYPKDRSLFYIGCLYDTWINKESGEVLNTFSMITCPANNMMRGIHNSGANKHRMPLIIDADDVEKWIDPGLSRDSIEGLMKPYDDTQMSAYTISKKANYSRENRNVPEILNEVNE